MGRRKRSELKIKATAAISRDMRSDIQQQGEVFENAQSPADASKSMISSSQTSLQMTLYTKSDAPSTRRSLVPTQVRIIDKEEIEFENDILSSYTQSDGIRSMESIESLGSAGAETMRQKCTESTRPLAPVVELKEVQLELGVPKTVTPFSEFMLCEALDPAHPLPMAVQLQATSRFELEHKFISSLVTDIQMMMEEQRRWDIELKVVYSRDPNGMPRCQIAMVRKMENAGKRRKSVADEPYLYGFDLPVNLAVADDVRPTVPRSRFKAATMPLVNVANAFFRGLELLRFRRL